MHSTRAQRAVVATTTVVAFLVLGTALVLVFLEARIEKVERRTAIFNIYSEGSVDLEPYTKQGWRVTGADADTCGEVRIKMERRSYGLQGRKTP